MTSPDHNSNSSASDISHNENFDPKMWTIPKVDNLSDEIDDKLAEFIQKREQEFEKA